MLPLLALVCPGWEGNPCCRFRAKLLWLIHSEGYSSRRVLRGIFIFSKLSDGCLLKGCIVARLVGRVGFVNTSTTFKGLDFVHFLKE